MSASANKSGKRSGRSKLPQHEVGSGNVFDDIGLANPGMELAKAKLAAAIISRIGALALTQSQAATRMGIHQPRVSQIKCGRLGEFSIGTLLELALKLGIDLDINVHSEQDPRSAGHMSVRGELVAI